MNRVSRLLTNRLLKQYRLKWVGPFIGVLYLTAPLIGMIGYIMNAATLYAVTLPYIRGIMPWLTMPVFFGIVLLLGSAGLFVFYKFVFPSYYEFVTKQQYIHENPMQKDLALIKKKLGIEEDEH